jgi:four helix bundle protein
VLPPKEKRLPMNAEHPASNAQRRANGRKYDLEERLLNYAVMILRAVELLPNTRTGNHIAGQLVRSGTAPLPNHGEAEAAESTADFAHKLKVCLKELRESKRWLLLIHRAKLLSDAPLLRAALQETEELIRIFVASLRTVERKERERIERRTSSVERRTPKG